MYGDIDRDMDPRIFLGFRWTKRTCPLMAVAGSMLGGSGYLVSSLSHGPLWLLMAYYREVDTLRQLIIQMQIRRCELECIFSGSWALAT